MEASNQASVVLEAGPPWPPAFLDSVTVTSLPVLVSQSWPYFTNNDEGQNAYV